ncbi:MAG TPA: hypothetical protein VLE89_04405 [Chlamydiales bacterium]|nr:hypothetical protein [Chlamydiales bacterium]
MSWIDIEKAFNRAILLSFSRKKMMLTFPVLVLCGILIVFCRAVAFEASEWVAMSLTFLPILLSSGVLLALGVLLVRIHTHEVKRLSLDFKRLIAGSLDLIVGTSYLSIPSVLVYLFLWILMGIFFLLKEIPIIGDFFSVVFAFAPFLLIFGSLLLCLFNLGLLFFVAPAAALQTFRKVSLAKRAFSFFQTRLLTSLGLFLIGFIPIGLLVGLLSLAALLTNVSFLIAEQSLSVALEWFFIMVPFCALLTPAVIFFFNFAAESYQLLQPPIAAAPFPGFSKASV